MPVEVQAVGEDDWRRWRDLRLAALADTPIGFGELLPDAQGRDEGGWRDGLRRPGVNLVGRLEGADVAMAGGFRDARGRAVLVAVYVDPQARRQGVLDALVASVRSWAAPDPLYLDVHATNLRARAAYRRLGFAETGERSPALLHGGELIEMVLPDA